MQTKEEAITRLREWFPKGATVYTILRHRSASGMSRTIGVLAMTCSADGLDVRHPNYATALAINAKEDRKREGVKMQGCGMDMGYEIAYRLGCELYDDGYALKHQWL